eukprot:s3134_g1.t1
MPERISGEVTVRQAVQDYQLRTFTSNDAPEPRAPPGVTVLCCHRLAALGRAGMVEFVPLPHREMQWAPDWGLYDALSNALWDRARIRLHEGKTRIWNAAGEEPPAVADLGGDAREPVWVGDWSLPPERQGLTVLGSPLGHDAFVAHYLQSKRAEHDRLLQRIRQDDLQAAWLLLQSCAAPRANYLLRILPPALDSCLRNSP